MSKPLVSDELWSFLEPLLPTEPPKPKGGRSAGARPRGLNRHSVRVAHGPALGDAPAGDGLWQRRDLLAAPARLASGRRLGAAAPRPAGPAGDRGRDRLVAGEPRPPAGAGQKGGEATGP